MKRMMAMLVALSMILILPMALAEDYQLLGNCTWLSSGGEQDASFASAAERTELGVLLGENTAEISVDGETVFGIMKRAGGSALMLNSGKAAPLTIDLIRFFHFACDMSNEIRDFEARVGASMSGMVSSVPERNDVYNSMFTSSRFLELRGAELSSFFKSREVAELLEMTGYTAQTWLEKAEAGASKAELTVYQASNAVLAMIDLSVPGMPSTYISYMKDSMGITMNAVTDTAEVTDWDETMVAIERGESLTGRSVTAFVLYFDDDNLRETYFEYEVTAAGNSKTYELTRTDTTDNTPNLKSLTLLVRRDGLRLWKADFDLETPHSAPFDPPQHYEEATEAEIKEALNATDGDQALLLREMLGSL